MREALIVWGGWSGHEPEQCAEIYKSWLEEDGFKVYVEDTTEAFADPSIHDLSLIIPIFTMSKIEKEEVSNLTAAVESGVGLAGHRHVVGIAAIAAHKTQILEPRQRPTDVGAARGRDGVCRPFGRSHLRPLPCQVASRPSRCR